MERDVSPAKPFLNFQFSIYFNSQLSILNFQLIFVLISLRNQPDCNTETGCFLLGFAQHLHYGTHLQRGERAAVRVIAQLLQAGSQAGAVGYPLHQLAVGAIAGHTGIVELGQLHAAIRAYLEVIHIDKALIYNVKILKNPYTRKAYGQE